RDFACADDWPACRGYFTAAVGKHRHVFSQDCQQSNQVACRGSLCELFQHLFDLRGRCFKARSSLANVLPRAVVELPTVRSALLDNSSYFIELVIEAFAKKEHSASGWPKNF